MHTQTTLLRPVGAVPTAAHLACRTILAVGIVLGSLAFAQSTGSVAEPQKTPQQTPPTPAQSSSGSQTESAPAAQVQQGPPPNAETDKNAPEIPTQKSTATFQVQVNLIEVRVVVRDAEGHPVSGLTKQDFQLLDDGKPQVISKFSRVTMRRSTRAMRQRWRAMHQCKPAMRPSR